jgi:hypothetical protein
MLDKEFWLLWGLFAVIILVAFVVVARKDQRHKTRNRQPGQRVIVVPELTPPWDFEETRKIVEEG